MHLCRRSAYSDLRRLELREAPRRDRAHALVRPKIATFFKQSGIRRDDNMDLRDIFNIEESGASSRRGDQGRDSSGRHRLHDRVPERERHSSGCAPQLCWQTDAYCILSSPASPVFVRFIFRDSSPRRIIESTERVHLAETDQARASLGPCVPCGTARSTSAKVHVVGVSWTWPFSRTQP